jgi:hypothetical protein
MFGIFDTTIDQRGFFMVAANSGIGVSPLSGCLALGSVEDLPGTCQVKHRLIGCDKCKHILIS